MRTARDLASLLASMQPYTWTIARIVFYGLLGFAISAVVGEMA